MQEGPAECVLYPTQVRLDLINTYKDLGDDAAARRRVDAARRREVPPRRGGDRLGDRVPRAGCVPKETSSTPTPAATAEARLRVDDRDVDALAGGARLPHRRGTGLGVGDLEQRAGLGGDAGDDGGVAVWLTWASEVNSALSVCSSTRLLSSCRPIAPDR